MPPAKVMPASVALTRKPSLRERVLSWQNRISEVQDLYYNLNLQYYDTLAARYNYAAEMDRLNTQMAVYKKCRDNIVANNGSVNFDEYNEIIEESGGTAINISTEIEDVLSQIDELIASAQDEYNTVAESDQEAEQTLQNLDSQIDEIAESVSISAYFTEDEYAELSNYIFEGSYTDEHITVTDSMTYSERFQQMRVLYARAKNRLERVSSPTQEFTIDVENFIFAKEFEAWSEQLETGCLINVELDDNDNALLFLSNIVVNYFDKTLKLTFGNRFNKFDQKSIFEDALGDIRKTANTVDYIKEVIYPIKNGEFNEMKEAIGSSRTLTMRDALSSENQEFVLDGSGYTGRKLLDNGTFDPRQVKITSKNIVFTDDAWQSCKVALGEFLLSDGQAVYGINAETLIGQIIMGNNMRILDSNGNDLLTVMDGLVKSEVSAIGAGMTQLQQTANDIVLRVSQLENTGVDSVTTTTGDTFNADGLRITKDGQEIESLMNNLGLYVTRSGETMLQTLPA